jgi:hypothetical protein
MERCTTSLLSVATSILPFFGNHSQGLVCEKGDKNNNNMLEDIIEPILP